MMEYPSFSHHIVDYSHDMRAIPKTHPDGFIFLFSNYNGRDNSRQPRFSLLAFVREWPVLIPYTFSCCLTLTLTYIPRHFLKWFALACIVTTMERNAVKENSRQLLIGMPLS